MALPKNTLLTSALIAVIAMGALFFRFTSLDLRPMHGDEANQAYKAGILLDEGTYRYDPYEHHGPTLYYLTLPLYWLRGEHSFAESTETTYRIVPAIFSLATVLLFWPFARLIGARAALWGAIFMALSPAMTFYGRYYIQESLLVFFGSLMLLGIGRYLQSGKLPWAILVGASAGLMHATKETCVIAFAAMFGAGLAAALLHRRRHGHWPSIFSSSPPSHWAAAAGTAVIVSVALFSSFFSDFSGPLDSVRAFGTYLSRAEGGGSEAIHDKPWYYYLALLTYTQRETGPVWTEGLILALGAVGAIRAFVSRTASDENHSLLPFFAFYMVMMTAVYSLIPYKTPWSMLGALHAAVIMAGVGAGGIIGSTRNRRVRLGITLVLALGAAHLGLQSYRASFQYAADVRNPYVYAHTSTALPRLVDEIHEVAALHPDGEAMRINIIKPEGDYWPLPWYLRKYKRVGYWREIPEPADAPVIIAAPSSYDRIQEHLHEDYTVTHYSLRPGVLLHSYIRSDLWERFLETRR